MLRLMSHPPKGPPLARYPRTYRGQCHCTYLSLISQEHSLDNFIDLKKLCTNGMTSQYFKRMCTDRKTAQYFSNEQITTPMMNVTHECTFHEICISSIFQSRISYDLDYE